MGTWGKGNFENDHALDFTRSELDRHLRAIEAIVSDNQRFRNYTDTEGELMPRIAIVTYLFEQYPGMRLRLPRLDLEAWKARYLEQYDAHIGEAVSGAYRQQRRAVIAATFDSLIRLAEN